MNVIADFMIILSYLVLDLFVLCATKNLEESHLKLSIIVEVLEGK